MERQARQRLSHFESRNSGSGFFGQDDAGAVGGAESLADDDVGKVESLILEADAEAFLGGEPEAGDASEG